MTGDEASARDAGAADIRRVTIVGAVLNVLLALGKLAGGLLASSQALYWAPRAWRQGPRPVTVFLMPRPWATSW